MVLGGHDGDWCRLGPTLVSAPAAQQEHVPAAQQERVPAAQQERVPAV